MMVKKLKFKIKRKIHDIIYEKHECPRRAEVPYQIIPPPDHWVTNNWKRKGSEWPKGIKMPRSCDYCGSVHPGDVPYLIENNFRISPSTKGYKYYIDGPSSISPCIKLYTMHISEEHKNKINMKIKLKREGIRDG